MNKEKLIIFEGKKIRKILHNKEWYFSVIDVIFALTDSSDSKDYWYRLKKREAESSSIELSTICRQLKLESSDGKFYSTDCANKEGIFRIIQSIPSKKAEPFKRWLAKVGSERIDEIENPELTQDRAKKYYEKKGYPKDWIEKRMRGIAVRQDLTAEWKNRGIDENREYAILTNEISQATFGIPIKEHKKIKNLDPKFINQNLRDHMTDLELIFSMLGERVATEITQERDSKGFMECQNSAKEGGEVAGNARKDAEKKLGRSIISKGNYLEIPRLKDKRIIKEVTE